MFDDLIRRAARDRGIPLPAATSPEPLAALDYADELALKQAALAAFWKEQRLPGEAATIVPAPQPRGYRSTTKRRAIQGRDGPELGFSTGTAASALDRADHIAVYAFLGEQFKRAKARPLGHALQYAIVRGTGPKLSLILNVRKFDASVIRGAKQVAEAAQESALGVASAFLYLDPTGSDYYLEARRPEGVLAFKRLFGPEFIDLVVDGVRLRVPPTAFSQVNDAMVPVLLREAERALAPIEGRTLLDLYCGYGLFSLTLGRAAARVIGVDLDGPAIEAARDNARRLHAKVRFHAGRLTGAYIVNHVDAPSGEEVALLDPPSQGTDPGVVEAIARRKPARVLHICCGTDQIPRETATWIAAGYRLARALPLDLFAGTTGLETLLAFSR